MCVGVPLFKSYTGNNQTDMHFKSTAQVHAMLAEAPAPTPPPPPPPTSASTQIATFQTEEGKAKKNACLLKIGAEIHSVSVICK